MAFNWLFGPRETHLMATAVATRSLTFDIDHLVDLVELLTEDRLTRLASARGDDTISTDEGLVSRIRIDIHRYPPSFDANGPGPRETTVEKLLLSSKTDRKGIIVSYNGGWVDFRSNFQPLISFSDARLLSTVTDFLLARGTPRPKWKPLLRFVPWAAAAFTMTTWVWFLVAETPPVSLAFAGTAIAASAVATCVAGGVWLGRRYDNAWPGHKFRESSRADTRDQITKVKAAAVTVPIGAVAGAIATWLLTR